jgi:hypothetical protein
VSLFATLLQISEYSILATRKKRQERSNMDEHGYNLYLIYVSAVHARNITFRVSKKSTKMTSTLLKCDDSTTKKN